MNIGEFRHAMTVQSQARVETDGGGYTLTPSTISASPWWCSIEPATAGAMERLAASGGALTANATHIMHGRYHADLTTQHLLIEGSRTFRIRGVQNIREDDMFTRVFAEEIVQ